MKNTILIVVLFIGMITTMFGQVDFKWDVIIDSLDGNKNQLYSKSKQFVGETWNSAQDVIQNDDKESGLILVKGLSTVDLFYQMNNHKWTFAYTVKLYVKDNKSRIIIENVYCKSARVGGNEWAHMPVSETYPSKKGLTITNVNKKRYLEIMNSLKQDLQLIVDSYSITMKNPIVDNPDW